MIFISVVIIFVGSIYFSNVALNDAKNELDAFKQRNVAFLKDLVC